MHVQNLFPIGPAVWPHFPVFWIVDPINHTKCRPGVSWGELFLGYVHSQMNPQTCTKFGANRSSRLTASQDFWICDPLTPPPAMPPGVLRGDLYLYAHSQMNPPTWTKVGANRSSRLTASPDFRMFDPLKPPKCPLCLSGQFVWRITIPRWICTCVPNLVPFGSAVFDIFPWLLNLWPPNPPPNVEGQIVFSLCPFPDESADVY